jgi:hypothetical protein
MLAKYALELILMHDHEVTQVYRTQQVQGIFHFCIGLNKIERTRLDGKYRGYGSHGKQFWDEPKLV